MRKPLVAGNWKMHGSPQDAEHLLQTIQQGANAFSAVEILVLPSFVYLPLAATLLKNSAIKLGAQNLYPGKAGAFTGEISAEMLKAYACEYVLIGHSERRALFQEDLTLCRAKYVAAIAANLNPILCVGETLAQRQAEETKAVLTAQLDSIFDTPINGVNEVIIAYEPIWAIGTGKTATPPEAQEMHAFIRQQISHHRIESNAIRILYGGSVKADNAASLFAMPDIDGVLVGGASLEASSFLAIAAAAELKVNS